MSFIDFIKKNTKRITALTLCVTLVLLIPATTVEAANYIVATEPPFTGEALVVTNITESGLFSSTTSNTTISSSVNSRQIASTSPPLETDPKETIIGYDENGLGLLDPSAFITEIPPPTEDLPVDGSLEDLPEDIVTDYAVNYEKSLRVLLTYNSSTYSSLDFKVVHVGDHCTVWTPVGTEYSPITTSQATTIGNEFDDKYNDMVAAFADPMDSKYSKGDLDNDGKIAIVCYDIQSIGYSGSSYTAGYFNPNDLFSGHNGTYGNYMDAIYVDSKQGMSSNTEQCFGTIVHELQHLIYRITAGDNVITPTFFNEGLSMAAEMMIYEGTEHAPLDRISLYNSYSYRSTFYKYSLTDWKGQLQNYSLSFLFMQYLRTQYKDPTSTDPNMQDGTILFKNMINTALQMDNSIINTNLEFFNEVLKPYFPDTDVETLISNFYTALYLKEDSGVYGFMGESWADSISTYMRTTSVSVNLIPGAAVYYSSPNNLTPNSSNASADIKYNSIIEAPYTVTASVDSYSPGTNITVSLYPSAVGVAVDTKTITSTAGSSNTVTDFTLTAPNGTYNLEIKKDGSLTTTIKGIQIAGDNVDLRLNDNPLISTIKLIPGDANKDGAVDVDDLIAVAGNSKYNTNVSTDDKAIDYNGDGVINFIDLSIIRNISHFGTNSNPEITY